MRRIATVAVVALILVVAGGLVLGGIGRLRDGAARSVCQNNLRQLAVGVENCHAAFYRYPTATVFSATLPPEQRLSWMVDVWPFCTDGKHNPFIDKTRPWHDAANYPPRSIYIGHEPDLRAKARPVEERDFFPCRCPGNRRRTNAGECARSSYVGVAGIGPDAARLPKHDRSAGFFGYGRATNKSDIKDGLATTLMMVETRRDNGPWVAGGHPTVRGLDPGGPPYFGSASQYGSFHRDGSFAAFADGSVRLLKGSIEPKAFEALATIAGGESVGDWSSPE